jgi:hypothetical protein
MPIRPSLRLTFPYVQLADAHQGYAGRHWTRRMSLINWPEERQQDAILPATKLAARSCLPWVAGLEVVHPNGPSQPSQK